MTDLSFMGGFNAADETHEQSDNSPLPVGDYYVQLESAELKDTKNGAGKGLNCQFEVLGDTQQNHAGRKLFAWFNLQHTTEIAQKIGQAEFASLCKAVGVLTPQTTDELIGKPLLVKVALDKDDKERNVIKKYSSMNATPAATPAAPTQPAPTAPAAAAPAAKMPWE